MHCIIVLQWSTSSFTYISIYIYVHTYFQMKILRYRLKIKRFFCLNQFWIGQNLQGRKGYNVLMYGVAISILGLRGFQLFCFVQCALQRSNFCSTIIQGVPEYDDTQGIQRWSSNLLQSAPVVIFGTSLLYFQKQNHSFFLQVILSSRAQWDDSAQDRELSQVLSYGLLWC